MDSDLKAQASLNQPDSETIATLLEAERITKDPLVKGYTDLDELFAGKQEEYKVHCQANHAFKKDYKSAIKRGLDISLLENVIAALAMGLIPKREEKEHKLKRKVHFSSLFFFSQVNSQIKFKKYFMKA